MNKYHVILIDELGEEFSVTVNVPDLVENVTEWVREEYPECSVYLVMPTF